jgi:hypothetical protein
MLFMHCGREANREGRLARDYFLFQALMQHAERAPHTSPVARLSLSAENQLNVLNNIYDRRYI